MDRNEKVEFTMEGYQKVLEALNIEGVASSTVANGNSSATVTNDKPAELKAALLAEVAMNFLL